MRRMWLLVALVAVGAVFTWPCGPFLPELEYAPKHGPVKAEEPTVRFDRGDLGVVRPEFYRKNLVVAYRYLAGVPLTETEVRAIQPREPAPDTRPVQKWLEARKTVPGATEVQNIDAYKQVQGRDFQMFQNCLDTAFDTAVRAKSSRNG